MVHRFAVLVAFAVLLVACKGSNAAAPGPAVAGAGTPTPEPWCKQVPIGDLNNRVCIETAGANHRVVWFPERAVLAPNREVVLVVRHESGTDVTATMTGDRGLTAAGRVGPGPIALAAADVSVALFSPRRPGPVTIKVTKKTGATEVAFDVELEVEQRLWGAIRAGFAAAFGDAASAAYEVRTVPGSQQSELALKSDSKVNFEATLGVAPYILDVLFCPPAQGSTFFTRGNSGRSHTGGCNMRFAPYFGFGVVGQQGNDARAFNGLYVGGDIEFSPSFSLVLAYTWRTVKVPMSGLDARAPVDVTDVNALTTDKTGSGFALILNTSPDFLQFAAPSSGGGGSTTAGGGR